MTARPRFILSAIVAAAAGAGVAAMIRFDTRTAFLALGGAILLFEGSVAFFFARFQLWEKDASFLLVSMVVAPTMLVSVIGASQGRELIIILMTIGIVCLVFTGLDTGEVLPISYKPYRRLLSVLWTFVAYAVISFLFAILSFFQQASVFLVLIVASALVFIGISHMVWRLYFTATVRYFLFWSLLIGLIVIELVFMIHLLPFGFLASGLFVTWFWYAVQLLTRFHFSSQGIIWAKQRWFLIINAVLYAACLFLYARWV